MSNFDFVRADWPHIADEARRAEHYTYGDPRSSLFYARRAVEITVGWLYEADATLRIPYRDDLSGRLHEPTFTHLVGPAIFTKLNLIRKQANIAVHQTRPVSPNDSLQAVRELFHFLTWFANRYASTPERRPVAGRPFDAAAIPKPQPGAAARTKAQLQALADEVAAKDAAVAELRKQNDALDAELAALRAQVAEQKAQNAELPDTHDYHEDETRDRYIDVLLHEAGWALDDPRDREYPVTGMPNNSEGGKGYVDYVLWGDDGLPLAVVEAKRTSKDPNTGQEQARLYADALQRQFGQRPVIFTTNGYEHWIWDDLDYPARRIHGFYTAEELALLIQRRSTRKPLTSLAISDAIAGRHYQQRAIRRVTESLEQKQRRALLVMATGSGKTRTVIALSDMLIRANRAKRILFLADRIALVNQAVGAFKTHLPDAAPVNLVTERDGVGRVYVSTYPTMMGLINESDDAGMRRFGPGHFDLIIVDEAHRSVYQKYGAIFSYFDSLLVGLTATPRDEIDHNTYGLFNLEDGVPTDSYELTDAVAEGYLVPPVGRSISTAFQREGIRYADLTPAEREQWDLLEWGDDAPDEVNAAEMNTRLYNADTVDKVLEILMREGRKVAGGDRLGKTIIFARNSKHAEFIRQRFDANYPEYAGAFARVITYQTSYAQSLIDTFSKPERLPQIAISVDMLDTGIDIPDVVNLVFFKPVHSKTKYWQMVGRGTRLRPDLYGPGEDKTDFMIFDVCQNIEYFNQDVPAAGAGTTEPLSARLFAARLALVAGIEARDAKDNELAELQGELIAGLHARVAGMNLDNFIVRAHRRAVERFADPSAWMHPSGEAIAAAHDLAALPSSRDVDDTDEQAKRFDLFALRAQLAALDDEPRPDSAAKRIRAIAEALASQKSIPAVAAEIDLIAAVAEPGWWTDATVPMIEMVRKRLRSLVHLIDISQKPIVYSDFTDTVTEVSDVELTLVTQGVDRARFREKAYAFLKQHEDDVVLYKLRHGKQLTPLDLEQLEQIMVASGDFIETELRAAIKESQGLGLFVRSILGMDRSAAADALSEFSSALSGNQLAFITLVIEHLTHAGTVDPGLLYEAPFTSVAPSGPEAIFTDAQVTNLIDVLTRIRDAAQPTLAG